MSNGTNELEKLAQERENILLAEVAALLHDWDKCQDWRYPGFWKTARIAIDQQKIINWGSRGSYYGSKIGDIPRKMNQISLSMRISRAIDIDLKDLTEKGRQPDRHGTDGNSLVQLLCHCHHIAHFDKPFNTKEYAELACDRIATAFGYEALEPDNLFDLLYKRITPYLDRYIIGSSLNFEERLDFLKDARIALENAWGDTRRPINEVNLWDWGSAVAAFYKAGIANHILGYTGEIRKLEWRLLRVTYNGLAFLERAPTIGDMLGRQAALTDALDKVRHLLEYEYPLGNEVYRDENGSAFVVPALDGDNGNGDMLHKLIDTHIRNAFHTSKLRGEVEPQILISHASKEAKELHTLLQNPLPPTHPFTEAMQCWWQGEPTDICTVCGVRPQGWGTSDSKKMEKAKERNVCYVCLERRDTRAEVWAKGRDACEEQREQWQHTVWTDEVADNNGRLALIVGHFDLDQWLSGEMIQTMLVVCDPPNFTPKNPSFARIQRVWRTTQQFWQDVWNEDVERGISEKHARLEISVSNTLNLGAYNTYDAEVDGQQLSVVWDSEKKCLITADNLHPWGGAERLKEQLQQIQQLSLSQPGGYGKQRKSRTSATIERVDLLSLAYTPAVKLLTEPRSFMALVPAAKAVEIASKIRHRYECEMSKVRNRLPMHLGLVFFGRRQPLFSALDAGRRMLDIPIGTEVKCTVQDCEQYTNSPADMQHHPPFHFNTWKKIILTHNKNGEQEQYTWCVSTVMGDGKTEDVWYPYVHLSDEHGNSVVGSKKQFAHPEHSNEQWAHISDVKKEDTISFTPSRFSYLFLDTSARRFEVGSAESLLPLEELERMRKLWKKLKGLAEKGKLSESKLHAIVALLRSKDEEWQAYEQNNLEIYQNFVETVLRKEGLIEAVAVKDEDMDITSRRLLRTFDLYQQILKEQLVKRTGEETK